MFINNSAFYITTNNVPNFGEDEDANVKRRLKIFETRSMPNPNSKIEPWYRQNSMHCIAWVAKEITKYRALVEKDELWYEDVSNERGEAEKIADLANGGGAAFFDFDKVKNLKFKDIFGPDTEKEKNDEKTIDEAAEPDSLIHESFISEAQTTTEKRKTDLEQTNTIEEEQWPMSQDDDDENLNTENYQESIFEELQSNFFRSSLNNNHLKIFRQKREGLKIPKRTRDAEYDGWCLVVGEPRPEFDFELFLQRHPTARRQIDRIRDMVSLRIMPENNPIRVPEVEQDNAAGVSGMVIDFFKQASKKIKLS